MDNEEPIVWHEPILDEYWEELEAKIDGRKKLGTYIKWISIENVEITKERLAALVAMFVSGRDTNSSTFTSFSNANLCVEGIISLSKLVDVSPQLITLIIRHNWIDNMESARRLSRSLKSHACINKLSLNNCDLGSSPEILSVILQSDVEYISLSNNNIDSLGAVKIAQYLEDDPHIGWIELDHNRLNDDDAILILQALKRNTHLRRIYLELNNFTSIGIKALFSCVFDSASLNAISESNHTLLTINIFNDFDIPLMKQIDCRIDRLHDLNRTQKIMLALQDKDALLQYLANVPVELIPEVLAFPCHQDVDICKTMNLVYSIMRCWNMPMLYSYHFVKSDAKRKRDVRDCCV
jgi:hypothetical protein